MHLRLHLIALRLELRQVRPQIQQLLSQVPHLLEIAHEEPKPIIAFLIDRLLCRAQQLVWLERRELLHALLPEKHADVIELDTERLDPLQNIRGTRVFPVSVDAFDFPLCRVVVVDSPIDPERWVPGEQILIFENSQPCLVNPEIFDARARTCGLDPVYSLH